MKKYLPHFLIIAVLIAAVGIGVFDYKVPKVLAALSVTQSTYYTNDTACNTSNVTLVFTTTPTQGDLLVVAITAFGSVSTPAGWTALDSGTPGAGVNGATFYHIVGASETNSYVFSFSGGSNCASGVAYEVTGENQSTPIDSHGMASFTADHLVTPTKTPTVIGEQPLSFFNWYFNNQNCSSYAVNSGWSTATGMGTTHYYGTACASYQNTLTTDTSTGITNTLVTNGDADNGGTAAIVLVEPAATSSPAVPKASLDILQTGSMDIKQGGQVIINNSN